MQVGLIMFRFRASILFHHMVCLPIIHRPILCMLLARMSTILHPYSLRINNPNMIMPIFLNPWGKHVKLPKTTLWLISSPTPDIPLKGMHFLVPPCQTLRGGLSINHHPDPCILREEKGLPQYLRMKGLSIWRRGYVPLKEEKVMSLLTWQSCARYPMWLFLQSSRCQILISTREPLAQRIT